MAVVTSYQTAEQGKFLQLADDSQFPPVSVLRYSYPDTSSAFPENAGALPVSSVDVYPKYAVLTHVVNPAGVNVNIQDGPILDAFGRFRVSSPTTLFDSKTLHDKQSLFWAQLTGGNNAFIGFTGTNSDPSVTLSASSAGDFAIRQTRQRFNYQPGKSQLVMFTGILSPVPNAIKRYGLYSSLTASPYNPDCGLYFETLTNTPSSIAVVQQNNSFLVPSLSANRENWNLDRLDGTGASGKILDLTSANIFVIDFEWLGVGRVRFGFVLNGTIVYCHQFNNTGNQGAYLKTPNQPIRAELRQTGSGNSAMKMICSTVISEGGSDFTGITRSINSGVTPITITTQYNRRALMGVRLQSKKLDSVTQLLNAQIANLPQGASAEAFYRYEIILNPTLGGTAVNWIDVAQDSNLQYSVVPNNTVTVTDGTVIASGFSNLNGTVELGGDKYQRFLKLGTTIDGIRDQIWLVFTPLDTKSSVQFAAFTFIESD